MPILSTDPVDLALTASGEIEVPMRFVSGIEGVRQRVQIRVAMFAGEWFANMRKGIRWLPGNGVAEDDAILGNPFDRARLLAEMRDAILGISGVSAIVALDATFDGEEREVNISVEIATLFGDTVIELSVEVP